MDTDPVSLAKMAVNKMKYKLFQAAYDPEAEKMAAEKKEDVDTIISELEIVKDQLNEDEIIDLNW
jgi:hypothetical protein